MYVAPTMGARAARTTSVASGGANKKAHFHWDRRRAEAYLTATRWSPMRRDPSSSASPPHEGPGQGGPSPQRSRPAAWPTEAILTRHRGDALLRSPSHPREGRCPGGLSRASSDARARHRVRVDLFRDHSASQDALDRARPRTRGSRRGRDAQRLEGAREHHLGSP